MEHSMYLGNSTEIDFDESVKAYCNTTSFQSCIELSLTLNLSDVMVLNDDKNYTQKG